MAYADEVLADGPDAWWRLAPVAPAGGGVFVDEMSGYTIVATGGNEQPITSPTTAGRQVINWPASPGGTYVSSDYHPQPGLVFFPLAPDGNDTARMTFSVEFWVRFKSLPPGYIIGMGTGWGQGWYFHLTNGASDRGMFHMGMDSGPTNRFSPVPPNGDGGANDQIPVGTFQIGQWYHVVYTVNADAAKVYINAVEIASGTNHRDPVIVVDHWEYLPWGDFNIWTLDRCEMALGELAIYSSALSPARVAAHYAAAEPPANTPYYDAVIDDDPTGYWRRNEVPGASPDDVAIDSSGFNRHGTYSGPLSGWPASAAGALVGDPDNSVTQGSLVAHTTDDDYTDLPTAAVSGAGARTVEFWIDFDQLSPANDQKAFSINTGSGGDEIYFTPRRGATTTVAEFVSQSATLGRRTIPHYAALSRGWAHIVCVAAGANPAVSRLYVNGVLAGTNTDMASPEFPTGFRLGSDADLATLLTAGLDEVAVYDYELPADRVLTHWLIGSGQGVAAGVAAEFFRRNVLGRR